MSTRLDNDIGRAKENDLQGEFRSPLGFEIVCNFYGNFAGILRNLEEILGSVAILHYAFGGT